MVKVRLRSVPFAAVLLCMVASVFAQSGSRPDVIWARRVVDGAITLDGKLDEAAWGLADSVVLKYGSSTTDYPPGSGYFKEGGIDPTDPMQATLKFLTVGNKLYLGVAVKDSTVGGGSFNQFDGLLMNLRGHSGRDKDSFIAPNFEYFYGWVTETWADPRTGQVGASPGFFGWAAGKRDSVLAEGFTLGDIWNAATTVDGVTNDDATPDGGWTTEVEFNLDKHIYQSGDDTRYPGGYDVTRPEGDILEFNIQIYDADWQWPLQTGRFSRHRAWLQGPWANSSNYNVMRIHARPDVTISSGPAPVVGPEITIPNGANFDAPIIDGKLDEEVWSKASGLDIRYDDVNLRDSYPAIGPYRSGQYQPEIGGDKDPVIDPADATMKWFFKNDILYFGFDVRDQLVTSNNSQDQWDGVRVFITDRDSVNIDHVYVAHTLAAHVGAGGSLVAGSYLDFLLTNGGAQAGLALTSGSTVDNPNDFDNGYTIELALDLTKFGYPAGRGDGVLHVGACLHDGDEFLTTSNNYGTRVWWMKEDDWRAAPAYAYMDPGTLVSVEEKEQGGAPKAFALLGNYPNPFNPSTTIHYMMPEAGLVTLKVYDILGRNVANQVLGLKDAGEQKATFIASKLISGVYFYRLHMAATAGGSNFSTLYGRMILVK